MAETQTQTYTIRHATEDDVPTILSLIRDLASYENALDQVQATPEKLLATLSFPSNPTHGYANTLLIFSAPDATAEGAAADTKTKPNDAKPTTPTGPGAGESVASASAPASSASANPSGIDAPAAAAAAGMALYFHNYSTWTAAPGIYLEDLYVRQEHRGRGYGKALLQALARECVAKECKRLDWSVLKWNRPSIEFYESEAVGAKMMSEWVGMRVDGEGLGKLAAGAAGAAGAAEGGT